MKLLTVNIEGENHLEKVIPFIKKELPDVVCLQEVVDKDVPRLTSELGIEGMYVPMMLVNMQNAPGGSTLSVGHVAGLLMLTKYKNTKFKKLYYAGDSTKLPNFNRDPNSTNRILLTGEMHVQDAMYRIITTHFTWTPDGKSSPVQHSQLDTMLQQLSGFDEFVLCGDFNAPRGKDVWDKLAGLYKDNIPESITTTLDPDLHRVKNLQLVVDGVFSTPSYKVDNVRVIKGVSDHQAIVADIQLN